MDKDQTQSKPDGSNSEGGCSRSHLSRGSTFAWIVDRAPTKQDGDYAGKVAVARWYSAYSEQDWKECAEGFIRPWQTLEECAQASIDDRRNGYPSSFTWSNSHSHLSTGYLNVYLRDDEYHIELHVGNQSFGLAYANEDIRAAKWYAKHLANAISATGGNVMLYGDLSGLNDDQPCSVTSEA